MATDAVGGMTGQERHDAHERLQTRLADAHVAVAVDTVADAGGLRTEIVVPDDGIPPAVLEAVANIGLALADVSHRTDAAVAVVR